MPLPTATPAPPAPTATPSSASLVQAKVIFFASLALGAPASVIEVQSLEPATWPDDALGCVVPGRLYGNTTVEGWRIIVAVPGGVLEYHSDGTADQIITCAEAERVSQLPSIDIVDAGGLADATAIAVLALPPGREPVEVVRVDDPDRVKLVISALAEPVHLSDRSSCDTLFRVEFATGQGTVAVDYACSGQGYVLRGSQPFWNGGDGIAPAGFQRIINEALAAREFPGFPPETQTAKILEPDRRGGE